MPKAYANPADVGSATKPSPFSLLFHIRKTMTLVNSVLHDVRVGWLPKALFLSSLTALLAAILLPELGIDTAALFGLPGIGAVFDALGLPVDVSLDWTVFAVAAFNLLKLFPAEIVGEHYDRLFRGR